MKWASHIERLHFRGALSRAAAPAHVCLCRPAPTGDDHTHWILLPSTPLGATSTHNHKRVTALHVCLYHSSGVVWEMKPKNRWKPFNNKNISLLEKAYQNQLSGKSAGGWIRLENLEVRGQRAPETRPPPKKYTHNLNFNCPLSWEGSCDVTGSQVNLSGATMMMRQPFSCQVRRNFLSGIQVEFKQSVHQRSLRAQLHWLQVNTHTPRCIHTCTEIHTLVWLASFCVQVDNQLPGAIFPIVFNPVLPPKSIALDTGGVFLLTSS